MDRMDKIINDLKELKRIHLINQFGDLNVLDKDIEYLENIKTRKKRRDRDKKINQLLDGR